MSMLRDAGAAVLSIAGTVVMGPGLRRDDEWSCRTSAPENHPFDIQPLLPAMTIEFGIEMLLHRPADAEIGDQRPGWRHVERPMNDLGFQDRDPAKPQPLGARRQPQCLYGGHDRIEEGFWHGAAAQSASLFGGLIGKHGDMDRRVFEALQLQPRILRALFAVVVFQRSRISAREAGFHFVATIGRFNEHEPPGLAVADRGRMAGKLEQRMHQYGIDGIAAKAADIATPENEVAERLAKRLVEWSRR